MLRGIRGNHCFVAVLNVIRAQNDKMHLVPVFFQFIHYFHISFPYTYMTPNRNYDNGVW